MTDDREAVRADVREAWSFLQDRLLEFEQEIGGGDEEREWAGHVHPAIARFNMALATLESTPAQAEVMAGKRLAVAKAICEAQADYWDREGPGDPLLEVYGPVADAAIAALTTPAQAEGQEAKPEQMTGSFPLVDAEVARIRKALAGSASGGDCEDLRSYAAMVVELRDRRATPPDAAAEIGRLRAALSRAVSDIVDTDLAKARAANAEAELARVREALKPFAEFGELLALETTGFANDDRLCVVPEDATDVVLGNLTFGEFSRARAALSHDGGQNGE